MNARRAAPAIAAALALAGCGQKGPLFLPDRAPQAVPATVPPTPAAPAAGTPAADEATRRKAPPAPDPAASK